MYTNSISRYTLEYQNDQNHIGRIGRPEAGFKKSEPRLKILLVPLKIVLNVLRYKPALN